LRTSPIKVTPAKHAKASATVIGAKPARRPNTLAARPPGACSVEDVVRILEKSRKLTSGE